MAFVEGVGFAEHPHFKSLCIRFQINLYKRYVRKRATAFDRGMKAVAHPVSLNFI